MNSRIATLVVASLSLVLAAAAQAQPAAMTFFLTSTGSGKGADYGGLAGADQHCQTLAAAAGAGSKTWRAYLSTTASGGPWTKASTVPSFRLRTHPATWLTNADCTAASR